jgi:hypothetical protein
LDVAEGGGADQVVVRVKTIEYPSDCPAGAHHHNLRCQRRVQEQPDTAGIDEHQAGHVDDEGS